MLDLEAVKALVKYVAGLDPVLDHGQYASDRQLGLDKREVVKPGCCWHERDCIRKRKTKVQI